MTDKIVTISSSMIGQPNSVIRGSAIDMTCSFTSDLKLGKKASIGLQSLSMILEPDEFEISQSIGNNRLTFQNVTDPNSQIHDITIPDGTYKSSDLIRVVNPIMNSTIGFSYTDPMTSNTASSDNNTETLLSFDGKQFNIAYCSSDSTRADGPPVATVKQKAADYTYALTQGQINLGTLTRQTADIDTFDDDSFMYFDQYFCRGSGRLSFRDNVSLFTFSFSVNAAPVNDVCTFTYSGANPLPSASFAYVNGDEISFKKVGDQPLVLRLPITGITVTNGNVISFTVEADAMQTGSYWVYNTSFAGIQGWCVGLISASKISEPNIFDNIDHGIMISSSQTMYDNYAIEPGLVYTKRPDTNWESFGYNSSNSYIDSDIFASPSLFRLTMYLDKGRIYTTLNASLDRNNSKVFGTIRKQYDDSQYEYGDYFLVCSLLSNGKGIENILFTKTLFDQPTPTNISISYLNESLSIIRDEPDMRYSNISFNFINEETAAMFGFPINSSYALIIRMRGNITQSIAATYRPLPTNQAFDTVLVDLPMLNIESFINGYLRPTIASIADYTLEDGRFTYYTPSPIFLPLSKGYTTNISKLNVKLFQASGRELPKPRETTVTLIIRED